jgi:hypothetical protein
MTDSVKDPEAFRRLLQEVEEFMRLYRSDPDFRRAANAILFGSDGSEEDDPEPRPRRGLPTLKEFLGR